MFKKLRNKFILINLATSTVVLAIAFTSIYLIAAASTADRPQLQRDKRYNDEVAQIFEERLAEERAASLRSLLVSLIITGACVEIMVALVSFFLAEQSIRPVRTAYRAQKEFIANASHEIKTPLAVIQANLEAADIHDNHWIDNIAIKTEELATLNNELLTLARIEAGTLEKKTEKINLKDFVQSQLDPLAPQIAKKKLTVKVRTKDLKKPDLTTNSADLKQLLNILLDNAIKYSATKITVTLSDRKISVKNDGATVKQDDLPHIFDRFYQTDKTKNGVGLGLAIAKQLAEKNHWTLAADSKTGKSKNNGWTEFTLAF